MNNITDERAARIEEFKRAHKGCTACLYIQQNVTLTAEDYADGKCPLVLDTTPAEEAAKRLGYESFNYTERS